MAGSRPQSNFTHLKAPDEQLVRLGLLAELYFAEDPNTCLLKLRQLTELLAQLVASQIGLFTSPEEKQVLPAWRAPVSITSFRPRSRRRLSANSRFDESCAIWKMSRLFSRWLQNSRYVEE